VTNFWSWLSQEWVGESTVPWNLKYLFGTWLRHWRNKSSIWTTPAMDRVAIDSQPSDLRAVPTKPCFFNTSTNHFCCVNVWGPGTTHCSQACQSWVYLSLGGHTWLSFIKTTALLFKHFRIGETPVLDISNLQELPGFTEEPAVIWRPQMCLWTIGSVSEKLGVWCSLRTTMRSLRNRGDIPK
jgi:hypothetical protein